MRIAIGGFQHETNTFAPSNSTFDDFVRGSGWPPLLAGEQIFDGVKGMNLPIAGFIEDMGKTSHKLIPTVWAAASPSAQVTEDAFERIARNAHRRHPGGRARLRLSRSARRDGRPAHR